ncbi:oxidoreductase, short chain dehydrogenase/reductase family [Lachnospiraceae bacterium KM106-2]|nr:oxidoreductase, short chain dehydrogenase/reductase family [Lachnospiraceae bacterium KM106-2]
MLKKCIDVNQLPKRMPPQHQEVQPGIEEKMCPLPIFDDPCYVGSGKLEGKVALITGGDSGIGRAIAVAYAKEGATVAISFLYEKEDAIKTKEVVEMYGGRAILIEGDIRHESVCKEIVNKVICTCGRLDILVNNAGVQYPQSCLENISKEQLLETYSVNVFPIFYMTKEALKHMKRGSVIINTTSITAYEGNKDLIDYSSTKGAVVTFTRSLALNLISRGIRVNAVAPGPIWTPLTVSSYSAEQVAKFGGTVPMDRPGQPFELAPAYVYLASRDSTYVSGQVMHVNGGAITES